MFRFNSTPTKKDFILCFTVAWIPLLILLVTNADENIISRFGSIMVLCGAAGEFMLMNIKMNNIYDAIEKASLPFTDVEISDSSQLLAVALHLTVLSGTLLWGFGDIFVLWVRSLTV